MGGCGSKGLKAQVEKLEKEKQEQEQKLKALEAEKARILKYDYMILRSSL
jgi:hypothetical protein